MKDFFSKLAGVRLSPIGRQDRVQRIGEYTIVRKVGSGSTSDVFLGLHKKTMATAAIKLLDPRCRAASHREMFTVESRMCGRTDHPNVVSMYGANLDDPAGPHLVMEYIDGQALDRFVQSGALLPVQTVVEVVRQCAEALRYLSVEGIIHRDIKPGNILLRKDGRIKIADFGCALFENSPAGTLRVAGSMPYMAPEQIAGKPLTHLSDMYSLGVVFFQLLTGCLPIAPDDEHDPDAYARKILRACPLTIEGCRVDVPAGISRIIARMLQKKPEDRLVSWTLFLHELYRASAEAHVVDEELSAHWQSAEIYRQKQISASGYDWSFGF